MSKELAVVSENEIVDYIKTFTGASALTVGETKQFVHVAQAFNLNPFKREIYAIPYEKSVCKNGKWEKERQLSIITGYEVYLKRAERTERLDGWEVTVEGENDNMKAKIIIHRKDWKHPFTHEVYFSEVAKKDKDRKPLSMWRTMPKFMLKKVAVAQGFRMAFPDEFGGMPYTADELPENMTKTPDAVVGTGTAEDPVVFPPKSEEKEPEQSYIEKPSSGQVFPYMLKDGDDVPAWFMALPNIEKTRWAPKGFSIRGGKICARNAS